VIRKGTDKRIDSYSAFYDNGHRQATGLTGLLHARGVDAVAVMGLAADVCVAYTVHDALAEGFAVSLITDGIRGVNMQAGDTERAIAAMADAGAQVTDSAAILHARG